MSNEEKILAELAAIRAGLSDVSVSINRIGNEFKSDKSEPTPADQLEVLRRLHEEFPFTDEENEAFGKYMEELENGKGRIA